MKIETKNATGKVLDGLVATCLGYALTTDGISTLVDMNGKLQILGPCTTGNGIQCGYSPTTNWEQGGPIVEKMMRDRGLLIEAVDASYAKKLPAFKATLDRWETVHRGPTWLTAGLLALVVSEQGAHAEVPDEIFALD